MKTILEGIDRLVNAEEQLRELEDKVVEITPSEQQTKREINKKK